MAKNKGGILALFLCLLLAAGCASSPAPSATQPAATADPLLGLPAGFNSSLFPQFFDKDGSLWKLDTQNGMLAATKLADTFSLWFGGLPYHFFYAANTGVYYTADLYVKESIVYGTLYRYEAGKTELLANQVRLSSLRAYQGNLLYVQNNEQAVHALYYYTGKSAPQRLDDLVFDAYFISADELVYLKDYNGAASLQQAHIQYDEHPLQNPGYDYSLVRYTKGGQKVLLGYSGPLVGIDRLENRVLSVQSAQTAYLQDGQETAFMVSVINLRTGDECTLDDVLLTDWTPETLYGPWQYLLALDPTRQDRACLLYRVDDYEPEMIDSRVTAFYYPDGTGEMAAYITQNGQGEIGISLHNGMQAYLPEELKGRLLTFNAASIVFCLTDAGELYSFVPGGEILPKKIASVRWAVITDNSLLYAAPEGYTDVLYAYQDRALPVAKGLCEAEEVLYNQAGGITAYSVLNLEKNFYDFILRRGEQAYVVASGESGAFTYAASADYREILFAFGDSIYYTYNQTGTLLPFHATLLKND